MYEALDSQFGRRLEKNGNKEMEKNLRHKGIVDESKDHKDEKKTYRIIYTY